MRLEGKVLYMPVLYYKVKLTMYTGVQPGYVRICSVKNFLLLSVSTDSYVCKE